MSSRPLSFNCLRFRGSIRVTSLSSTAMPNETTQMRGVDQWHCACDVPDQWAEGGRPRLSRGGKGLRLNELGFRSATPVMKTSPAKNLKSVTRPPVPTPASHMNLSQPLRRALKKLAFESQAVDRYSRWKTSPDRARRVRPDMQIRLSRKTKRPGNSRTFFAKLSDL